MLVLRADAARDLFIAAFAAEYVRLRGLQELSHRDVVDLIIPVAVDAIQDLKRALHPCPEGLPQVLADLLLAEL